MNRSMSKLSSLRVRIAFAQAALLLTPLVALAQSASFTIADSARACPGNLPYPPAAQRNLATGRSLVRVVVDSDGHVVDAHLLRPSGVAQFNKQLDSSAIQGARECHFPASTGARSGEMRRGVVQYEWRIDGLVDDNPYSVDPIESLKERATNGDASAGYWIYLRSDPLPNAPASADALHWLSFAAEHGMQKAQQELERLRLVGEQAAADEVTKPAMQ
jgi:TonB family protein